MSLNLLRQQYDEEIHLFASDGNGTPRSSWGRSKWRSTLENCGGPWGGQKEKNAKCCLIYSVNRAIRHRAHKHVVECARALASELTSILKRIAIKTQLVLGTSFLQARARFVLVNSRVLARTRTYLRGFSAPDSARFQPCNLIGHFRAKLFFLVL